MSAKIDDLLATQNSIRLWLTWGFEPTLELDFQTRFWENQRLAFSWIINIALISLVLITLGHRSALAAHGLEQITWQRVVFSMPVLIGLSVLARTSRFSYAHRDLRTALLAVIMLQISWNQIVIEQAHMQPPFSMLLLLIAFIYLLSAVGIKRATLLGIGATAAYLIFGYIHGSSKPWEHLMALFFANSLGLATGLANERSTRSLFLAERIATHLSQQDALTGLLNRKAGVEHLSKMLRLSQRQPTLMALVLLDVDHFKRYNDGYGHVAGDAALRTVGLLIQQAARRPMDMAFRYGGEEFLIFLYGLDASNALLMADNLRKNIEAAQIPHRFSPQGIVTASFGVCCLEYGGSTSALSWIETADTALYQAKEAGRNCCRMIHVTEFASNQNAADVSQDEIL